jgi:hypothetical protein
MIGRVLDDTLVAVVSCALLGTTMWMISSPSPDAGTAPEGSSVTAAVPGPDQTQFFDREFTRALGGRVLSVTVSAAEGMGRRACLAFAEGASASDVRRVLVQKGVSDSEASVIVLASRVAYCPEQTKAAG